MAYQPTAYPGYPPPRPRGLGITALVLGIVAILTLVLCGLGGLVAIAGLIVGTIAVARNNGRGMAVAGIVLSAIALLVVIAGAVWFYSRVAPCSDRARYPTNADRDRCLQHRVPFFRTTTPPR